MVFTQPYIQPCLIIDEEVCYSLKVHSQGMTLTTDADEILFELNEPVLLAQGTLGENRQIHLAYIKLSSELCYTIISPTGEQQTMVLGKVDIKSQRFDRLYIFPLGKIIHIFYACSHMTLPDVWRITHLFWNGQSWKTAQLGEVVDPYRPLFQVLLDSRSNLHVLMLTFIGKRSILLASVFNGSFHLWSKPQEALSIPRQVVDMTALITDNDQALLFWAARQPSSDRFEIGQANQGKVTDFKLSWSLEEPVASDLHGPWLGMGVMKSQGKLNLFAQGKMAILFHKENSRWIPQEVMNGQFPLLQISRKTPTFHYTSWGQNENYVFPLFEEYLGLPSKEKALPAFQECANSMETLESTSTATEILTPQPPIENGLSLATTVNEVNEVNELNVVNEVKAMDEFNAANEVKAMDEVNKITESDALMESLEEKGISHPEVLAILKELQEKNQENLRLLQEIAHKINSPSQHQVAEKKGFWQRWFT